MKQNIKASIIEQETVSGLSKLQLFVCKLFKIVPKEMYNIRTRLYYHGDTSLRISDIVVFEDTTLHYVDTYGTDEAGKYILTKSITLLDTIPKVGNSVILLGQPLPEA